MAKPIALNEIRTRATAFVTSWKDEPGAEKQQAQSFVRDLLGVYGVTESKAALYEKHATRASTGRHGYIDALLPGLCAIEMKSKGADLAGAEQQALDYLDSLPDPMMPRYVLCSDFASFRLLDLHATDPGYTPLVFPLESLPKFMQTLAFIAGYQKRSFGSQQQETASIKAARIMAELYGSLEESGYDDHAASVFLVRLLFCLYADDAGVWERDLFMEFVETRTAPDGSDLGAQLTLLFQVLNQPTGKRQRTLDDLLLRFPYVNGGVFAEPISIPAFDTGMRDKLGEACAFDWASISPAIFGSLFQAVKDKKARRELGEHYTTETNILKTINPLFMDELRERFTNNANDIRGLKRLRKELGKIRVLDPACGCGNFLVVAYRELRALDLAILERLQAMGDRTEIPTLFFTDEHLPVTLNHMAGIELEEWPARIADTALQLVHHQANQAMEIALGAAPDPLPLGKNDHIVVGNALRLDWANIVTPSPNVRIVGNPPFVGQYTKGADQTADMKFVWGKQYDGYLDYVTAWFKKAADYFAGTPGRFAFVSTNSIAQGQPVPALFGPIFDAGWRIRFAHQTFAWTSEAPGAAAVHCVIIGFDRHERTTPILYGYRTPKGEPTGVPVPAINAYLVDGPNVLVTKRSQPLGPDLTSASFGSKPADGGHLIVEAADYDTVAADPIAAKYLRPYLMGKELIHSLPRWCLWLADLDPADLAKSPLLRERVQACRDYREASPTGGDAYKLRATPHLFRPNGSLPTVRYLGIPRVFSQTRTWATCVSLEPTVIAGDSVFMADDPDGYLFAVISSSMFLAWQAAVGGRLKSDYRFSNTLVWNTLPLPPVTDKMRTGIIAAGQAVLDARALHPDRSLADHYNPLAMDPALLKAHHALDRVVDKAFGARKPQVTMEDRQATLFARYADLTKK